MNPLQVEMNNEIDKLISLLEIAKNLPGFQVKVSAVDRALTQVQGFVSYWDMKLNADEQTEV